MHEIRQTRKEFSHQICDGSHKLLVNTNFVFDLVVISYSHDLKKAATLVDEQLKTDELDRRLLFHSDEFFFTAISFVGKINNNLVIGAMTKVGRPEKVRQAYLKAAKIRNITLYDFTQIKPFMLNNAGHSGNQSLCFENVNSNSSS